MGLGGADVNLGIDIEKKGQGDKEAAAGLELVAKAADNASDELRQLDRKLLETRAAMVGAGKDFANTGEISPFKALLKDERQLTQVRKTLSKLTEDVKDDLGNAGDQSSRSFLTRLEDGLSSGLPEIGPIGSDMVTVIGASAVAVAPAVGAAIASAVLLGLGAVGIGAGIALNLKDPAIVETATGIGKDIGNRLHIDASVFREPIIDGLNILAAGFDRFEPRLQRVLAGLAPEVDALAEGIAGLVDKAGPGLEHAFAAAAPFIHQLAADLPGLGSAMGFFFDQIAAAGPGATAFFHDLITVTEATLTTLGLVTNALSKLYELSHLPGMGGLIQTFGNLNDSGDKLHKSFQLLHQDGADAADSINKIGAAAASAGVGVELAADDFAKLSSQIASAGTSSDLLAAKMTDKLLNATLGLDQATLGFAESQNRLIDAVDRNGLALDIATDKGQANREAILGVVAANIREYDSMVAVTGSTTEAAIAYDNNTASLEEQMRQAGFTQEEIDGLIGKYRSVPSNVDTQIATLGLTQAINGLADLLRQINGIPSYKSITVNTNYTRSGEYNQQVPSYSGGSGGGGGGYSGIARRHGGYVAAATGMITSSPTVLFGERGTGREAYIPKLGISDSWGLELADTAAGWHGGMVVPKGAGGGQMTVRLSYDAPAGSLEEAIMGMITARVVNAGGNVQAALGRRGH